MNHFSYIPRRNTGEVVRGGAGRGGCGEGVVYLTSLGRPSDIGFTLARPVILIK